MLEACRHCGTNVFPNKDRTCPNCQGHLDGEAARPRLPNGLISRTCPNCGSQAHHKVKPDRFISFTFDRVCDECSTLYVLPTPPWAAMLFIVIGLLLGGLSGADMYLHFRDGQLMSIVWKSLFLLLGLASFLHGLRALAQRPVN